MQSISELRWKCRRGMRELDLLLENYLDKYYQQSDVSNQKAFEKLLDEQDSNLTDYFFSKKVPVDLDVASVVNEIITTVGKIS